MTTKHTDQNQRFAELCEMHGFHSPDILSGISDLIECHGANTGLELLSVIHRLQSQTEVELSLSESEILELLAMLANSFKVTWSARVNIKNLSSFN